MTVGYVYNYKEGTRKARRLVNFQGRQVRSGFGPDRATVLEWYQTYRHMEHLIPDAYVLDIGAHIGTFSAKALELGAKSVVAVEPELGSFSVLRAVLGRRKHVTLINAAVGVNPGIAYLSVPRTGNSTSASTVFQLKGRHELEVKQLAFKALLKQYRPTLLKVDCEGAELDFLDGNKLPKHVRVVTGELHREGPNNEKRCKQLIQSFSEWDEVHPPKSYSFHRCWTVAWQR